MKEVLIKQTVRRIVEKLTIQNPHYLQTKRIFLGGDDKGSPIACSTSRNLQSITQLLQPS